jgi:hypothetical protein
VAFNEEAISSGGDGGAGGGNDQIRTAGGVTGVADDGKRAGLFDEGDGVGVEGVAGGGVEAANAALTEDDPFVSPAGDVFGRLEPLLNS